MLVNLWSARFSTGTASAEAPAARLTMVLKLFMLKTCWLLLFVLGVMYLAIVLMFLLRVIPVLSYEYLYPFTHMLVCVPNDGIARRAADDFLRHRYQRWRYPLIERSCSCTCLILYRCSR